MFEFHEGQRGSILMFFEEHIYTKHSSTGFVVRWRCENRKCRGYLLVEDDKKIINHGEHTHPSQAAKIRKIKFNSELKKKAKDSSEPASTIIANALVNVDSDEVRTILPKFKTMNDSILKNRNMVYNSSSTAYVDIPDNLRVDFQGNPFLLYDSGIAEQERYIIFCHDFKKKYLKGISVCLVDGTFRSSPNRFYHLVVLHGEILGRFYPMIYILMTGKSEEFYTRVFSMVRNLLPFAHKNIICDFEMGLINAVKNVFTESRLNGCLFHFSQSIWRKVQTERLITEYKNSANFRKLIKYLVLLSFVPISEVHRFYFVIKGWSNDNIDLDVSEIFNYFEKTYLNIIDNNGNPKTSLYGVEFWNVNLRVLLNVARTTNSAEAWHRTLNFRIHVAHPNIAHFINEILLEEEKNRFTITRNVNGIFEMNKNLLKEEKIRIVVQSFHFFDPMDYLAALDNIYKLNFEINLS